MRVFDNTRDDNGLRIADGQRAAVATAIETELGDLADALAGLDDAERAAVVGVMLRLVKLSPAKRAAILTLTGE